MPMQDQSQPGAVLPNHNFGPLIESAARLCEKIDLFDNNDGLLDQVVYGIVHPALCNPDLKDFTKDRELVALLLVRHFKKFGGLVLPPLGPARQAQEAHAREVAAGRQPGPIRYPNWAQNQTVAPAPGFGGGAGRGGAPSRGRGDGNVGRGGGSGRGGRGGGY